VLARIIKKRSLVGLKRDSKRPPKAYETLMALVEKININEPPKVNWIQQ
jgi:hypothetical protein